MPVFPDEEVAFTALYDHYHALLRAYAARLLAQPHGSAQIDDLVQETFARLWQAMTRRGLCFETEGIARAYLCRIALNLVRDQWRRECCVPMERLAGNDEETDNCQPGPVVEPFGEALDRLIDARAALLALPAPTRALILRAVVDPSSREPSEKNRLARARAALRQATQAGEERRHA